MANIITGSDGAVKVLREVVRRGIAPTKLIASQIPHKKQQLLLGISRPAGGSSEYNGYFKIIAVPVVDDEGQPTGQFEVHIFDGARDVEIYGYSENKLKVNGKFKRVSAYKSEPLSNGGYTFYIQFNPGDETVAILRKDLVISSWVDLDTVENSEIIGEVVITDGVAQVRQRAFGMIHLIAFAPCGAESVDGDDNAE